MIKDGVKWKKMRQRLNQTLQGVILPLKAVHTSSLLLCIQCITAGEDYTIVYSLKM